MKKFSFALLILSGMLVLGYTGSTAQQKSEKIYWMSYATVPLGKMSAYHKLEQEKLVPAREKAGYHYVAGWQTIVGEIEEVITVTEFDDMNAYQKARAALLSSPEWKAAIADMADMTRGAHTSLMSALPYIKSK